MKTAVIKIGGSVLAKSRKDFIGFLKKETKKSDVVVVHGGGPEINSWLEKFDIKPGFVSGLRYTDAKTLEVVCMVLAGKVNKELVAALNDSGIPSVGFSASDGKIAVCRRINALGFVGSPVKINRKPVMDMVNGGIIPVIASLGYGHGGVLLNINADVLAMALACDIKAGKLVFVTDVPGIMKGGRKVIKNLSEKLAKKYIADGTITGGMLPKVKSCLQAVRKGVGEVVITNLEGKGTVIKGERREIRE